MATVLNGGSRPVNINNNKLESFEEANGDHELSPKQMMGNGQEERLKWRAKRPSAKTADVSGTSPTNGQLVTGIRVNGSLPKKFAKNSRRPRGRYGRGLTKKGGAGGKGTWGKLGSELVGVEEGIMEDPHDPNYDSDSQDNCKFEAITPPLNDDEIERHVSPVISEYFEHGYTEEVISSLEDLNMAGNEYQILVMAVSMSMEKKAFHREMTSVLLSDLYSNILSEEDIERGFDVLLKCLPDLILDTPTAPDMLGSFIARAVADDCIPPKFVNQYKDAGDLDSHGRIAIDHASALLNMKHGLVKLDTVWGVTGGMRPVKYLVRQIQLLLREYLSSGVLAEAVRCLQELEVPHFYHELVYEAVMIAIEDTTDNTMDLIRTLLKSLADSMIVTPEQLKNGFIRVYEELPEIRIDVPHAYPLFEKFVLKCDRLVPSELKEEIHNSRSRKRFVSEGDGGLIKESDF